MHKQNFLFEEPINKGQSEGCGEYQTSSCLKI